MYVCAFPRIRCDWPSVDLSFGHDTWQVTYGSGFVNEKAAIEAAIKAEHTTNLGKVQAVVGFAFTVGTEETDAMVYQQACTLTAISQHTRCTSQRL